MFLRQARQNKAPALRVDIQELVQAVAPLPLQITTLPRPDHLYRWPAQPGLVFLKEVAHVILMGPRQIVLHTAGPVQREASLTLIPPKARNVVCAVLAHSALLL